MKLKLLITVHSSLADMALVTEVTCRFGQLSTILTYFYILRILATLRVSMGRCFDS